MAHLRQRVCEELMLCLCVSTNPHLFPQTEAFGMLCPAQFVQGYQMVAVLRASRLRSIRPSGHGQATGHPKDGCFTSIYALRQLFLSRTGSRTTV